MKNIIYTSEYETQIGIIKMVYIHNYINIMDIYLNDKLIDIPLSWKKQTSGTIIRKLCDKFKK